MDVQGRCLAVVGLGYVGLPLAVRFAKYMETIGFDINSEKIKLYESGNDPTNEVGSETISETTVEFTSDAARLSEADFIIVAVPTPVNGDKTPDLLPVTQAASLVGHHMSRGAIIVFESTVYPGVTEDICVKALEEASGFRCGVDFKIGYSPERINPGDRVHTLENIVKIVSGIDDDTVDKIAALYSIIVKAGIFRAPSIKVAEAAKLVENAQRDINIAFMNELAMVFDRMNIATSDVIAAMDTKWNALGFKPGLVGGHCIGVDPYYFIYQAELLGYHSQIIASGRKINDGMGKFVADALIKRLIQLKKNVHEVKIYLMGITFKEDCPDVRNSRAVDVEKCLSEYGIKAAIVDSRADVADLKLSFGLELTPFSDIKHADCLVFLVAHCEFRELSPADLKKLCSGVDKPLIIDVKSIFDGRELKKCGFSYWSL